MSAHVGRTGERRDHSQKKEQEHRAAPSIGVMRITSVSASREWARSRGGARSSVRIGRLGDRQPSNRSTAPSTRPRPASGSGVIRARSDAHRTARGSLARRRVVGQGRARWANLDVSGCSWASAIVRSSRVASSAGRARLERSGRTSSASDRGGRWSYDIAPLSGFTNPSCGSGRRGLARAHVGHRASFKRFAENGGRVSGAIFIGVSNGA